MFTILNACEVRLMGRKYLYEGETLYYVKEREEVPEEAWSFEAWKGEVVENPHTLQQFKQVCENGTWSEYLMDFVSERHPVVMDRWEYAIREAVKAYPDGFRFSELVYPVCRILGATHEEAVAGVSYHPYNGRRIEKTQGWIATWVEERSPDSRQRYFCAGKMWDASKTRPLLFVNDGLYESNTKANWCPYIHVRGTKWFFNPAAAEARPQPSQATLEEAAVLYKKQGMRGAKNRTPVTQDQAGTVRVVEPHRLLGGAFLATALIGQIV